MSLTPFVSCTIEEREEDEEKETTTGDGKQTFKLND
jgi:hypothetical protein